MMTIRCSQCGYHYPYREGLRFCAGCACPVALIPCATCGGTNFPGDRHCAFCAASLGATATLSAPVMLKEPTGPDEFLDLAEEAFLRAQAAVSAPLPVVKKHLSQADLDRLFS